MASSPSSLECGPTSLRWPGASHLWMRCNSCRAALLAWCDCTRLQLCGCGRSFPSRAGQARLSGRPVSAFADCWCTRFRNNRLSSRYEAICLPLSAGQRGVKSSLPGETSPPAHITWASVSPALCPGTKFAVALRTSKNKRRPVRTLRTCGLRLNCGRHSWYCHRHCLGLPGRWLSTCRL